MTSGRPVGASLDPAAVQLLVTGVREAIDAAGKRRPTTQFRRTADPALFANPAAGPPAGPPAGPGGGEPGS